MPELPSALQNAWRQAAISGQITALTGAGISAESGIPTFRGKDGYWTVGSAVYTPTEMATIARFREIPWDVWHWYLYRCNICHSAKPNAGHAALVELEQRLQERFCLITQNVDGLHLAAGSSPERTYEIHGNISFMRRVDEDRAPLVRIPPECLKVSQAEPLSQEIRNRLQDADGTLMRPHVLWFDEYYNEHHFRFQSSIQRALQTDVLVTIGTTGATNLPRQIVAQVLERGGTVIDINPEENVFATMAQREGGFFLQGSSGELLPRLVELLK
jgi:NAD-dependent deacetylase